MNTFVTRALPLLLICFSGASIAGKVPVITNSSLGINGMTIPSGTTSAPSPAAPAAQSVAPSVSLPPSVMTSVLSNGEGQQGTSGASGGLISPTTAQVIDAVVTMSSATNFSPEQASAAISKISSILNNVELAPNQSAQLIEFRESLEAAINPQPQTER